MALVSAFVGSVTTLAAIAIAWPLFPEVSQTGLGTSVPLALALPLASGGAIALFHNKLLSLPPSGNRVDRLGLRNQGGRTSLCRHRHVVEPAPAGADDKHRCKVKLYHIGCYLRQQRM